MLRKYLNNEKGMGFADLLGAMIIVLIALTTMFLIILSSQIRVTQNYHYRKALLGALSRLETIKYYNRNFTTQLNLSIPGIEDPLFLDENDKKGLEANVTIIVNTTHGLMELSPYAGRHELSIKVEWTEKSASILHFFHPRPQSILLREDYYFQSEQGNS